MTILDFAKLSDWDGSFEHLKLMFCKKIIPVLWSENLFIWTYVIFMIKIFAASKFVTFKRLTYWRSLILAVSQVIIFLIGASIKGKNIL